MQYRIRQGQEGQVPAVLCCQDWRTCVCRLCQEELAARGRTFQRVIYGFLVKAAVPPDKCYAALLKHQTNGVLALVSNLRRDAQTVPV